MGRPYGMKIFKLYEHPEIRAQIEVMKIVPSSRN
jgi:hypothetical protein